MWMCVCLLSLTTSWTQELTEFWKVTYQQSRWQVWATQLYTEGSTKCGESQAWKAYSRTYRFKQSPRQPHWSGYWTNDFFSWTSYKNADHTQKDIYLNPWADKKAHSIQCWAGGCLQGKQTDPPAATFISERHLTQLNAVCRSYSDKQQEQQEAVSPAEKHLWKGEIDALCT